LVAKGNRAYPRRHALDPRWLASRYRSRRTGAWRARSCIGEYSMNILNRAQRRRPVAARAFRLLLAGLLYAAGAQARPDAGGVPHNPPPPQGDPLTTTNASGWLRTFTPNGAIDTDNAFFQSLGSNGRSCNTCHRLEDAWSITPEHVRERFDATDGTDPLFRSNDGSNSPFADVSTVDARRQAYSMLLSRGVLRVGIGVPDGAEFTLDAVDDPYGYASAAELSLFRRPLPSTNIGSLTTVMWDGRETLAAFVPPMDAGMANDVLVASLHEQAIHATLGHAQGTAPPTEDQLAQIIAFEMQLTTAQVRDNAAGMLNADDALGGPRILANQRFNVGINDTLGADPTGAAFNPVSMTLFSAWDTGRPSSAVSAPRAAVARGERLFNTRTFDITDVGGLNDVLGLPVIEGTCTSCHNTPNIGNHSVALPLDLGLTDAAQRTADLPLYTLRNNLTGETVQTTDPGKALVSGKWADIGKFKGPILRGLAARAPYFHNGAAATLADAIAFYDTRFAIGLTAREKIDLEAFLRSL
jgi:cytochrome c peroxidase